MVSRRTDDRGRLVPASRSVPVMAEPSEMREWAEQPSNSPSPVCPGSVMATSQLVQVRAGIVAAYKLAISASRVSLRSVPATQRSPHNRGS